MKRKELRNLIENLANKTEENSITPKMLGDIIEAVRAKAEPVKYVVHKAIPEYPMVGMRYFFERGRVWIKGCWDITTKPFGNNPSFVGGTGVIAGNIYAPGYVEITESSIDETGRVIPENLVVKNATNLYAESTSINFNIQKGKIICTAKAVKIEELTKYTVFKKLVRAYVTTLSKKHRDNPVLSNYKPRAKRVANCRQQVMQWKKGKFRIYGTARRGKRFYINESSTIDFFIVKHYQGCKRFIYV